VNGEKRSTYRDNESEGFTGASFGGAEDVSATERVGERSSLDVGHDDELGLPQGVLGFLGERELLEARRAGVARVGVVL